MEIYGLSQVTDVHKNDERDDMSGAGYMPNIDEAVTGSMGEDSAGGVDGTSGSAPPPPPPSGGGGPSSSDGTYLDNSNGYNDAVNTAQAIGNAEDNLTGNVDPGSYITSDGTYEHIDSEKLYQLLRLYNMLTNLEIGIDEVYEEKEDLRDLIDEVVTGVSVTSDDIQQLRENAIKNIELKVKGVSDFAVALYKKVNQDNLATYQQKMKDIDNRSHSCEGFVNWITGGKYQIEDEEDKKTTTEEYYNVCKDNLQSLMHAMSALGAVLKATGDSDLNGLGMSFDEFCRRIQHVIDRMNAGGTSAHGDYFDKDDMGNLFGDILHDIKHIMSTLENIFRAEISAKSAKDDEKYAVEEETWSQKMPDSMVEFSFIAARSLFNTCDLLSDTSFNTLMATVKEYNDTIQLAKNVEKLKEAQGWRIAGAILTIIAVIVAIVVTCLTFGGASETIVGALALGAAVAGIAAGISSGLGGYLASQLNDSFDPADPNYGVTNGVYKKPGKTGDKTLDAMNDVDRGEEELGNNLQNQDLCVQQSDGNYALNGKALAAFTYTQNVLHNILKAIVATDKAKRDLARSVDATITGKSVREHGDSYLAGNIESIVHERDMMTQAIKFQLNDIVTAKNIKHQNEMMAEKSLWSMLGGTIGAVVGVVLGILIPGVGYALGMAVGAAIGNGITSLYFALRSDSGYQMQYKMDSAQFDRLLDMKRKQHSKTNGYAEEDLENTEFAVYENMMDNGIVSTGDGYQNVDYGLVAKAYSVLGNVQAIREALAKVRAAKVQMAAEVSREVLGVSGLADTSLVTGAAKAEFQMSMAIVQGIVKDLQEKSAVNNRARDAEKAVISASVSLGVSVVVGGTGCALGGAGAAAEAGSTMEAVGQFANSMTIGVMGAVNGAVNMIMSSLYATSGYGDYGHFDANEIANKVKTKGNGNSPSDQLTELERSAYQQAGDNLMRTVTGGAEGVDTGLTAELSQRIEVLNNLKEAFAMVADARKNLKADVASATGMSAGVNIDTADMAYSQASVSQQIMNCLIQGMEVISQRQNQMSDATRQAIISAVDTGMSIVSSGLGAAAAAKALDAKAVNAQIENLEKVPVTTQPLAQNAPEVQPAAVPATASTPTTTPAADTPPPPAASTPSSEAPQEPAAPQAALGGSAAPGDTGRPESSSSPNNSAVTNASKNKQRAELMKKADALAHDRKMLGFASAMVYMLSGFSDYYVGDIYDHASEGKESHIQTSGMDGKKAKADKGGKTDIYTATGNLEAGAMDSEILVGQYSMNNGSDIILHKSEQLAKTWLAGIQSACMVVQNLPIDHTTGTFGDVNADQTGAVAVPNAPNFALDASTLNQMVNIMADPSMSTEHAQSFVQSLPARVQAGTVDASVASQFLAQLQTARPEIQTAAAAATLASIQAQQTQRAPQAFRPEETQSSRNKGAIDRADQLIENSRAKAAKAQEESQIRAKGRETQVPEEVEAKKRQFNADKEEVQRLDREISSIQRRGTATGTAGTEEAATPQQQLNALQQRRSVLLTEMNRLSGEIETLSHELDGLKANAETAMADVKGQIGQIDEALAHPENLTPLQQANLRAKRNMLEQAQGILNAEIHDVENKVTSVKQQLRQVRGELQGVNFQISRLGREIERGSRSESEQEDDSAAAARGGGGRGSAASGDAVSRVGALNLGLGPRKQLSQMEQAREDARARELEEEMVFSNRDGGGSLGVLVG